MLGRSPAVIAFLLVSIASLLTPGSGLCTDDPGTVVLELGWHCISPLVTEPPAVDHLYNVTTWVHLCRVYGDIFPCYHERFKACGDDYVARMYQAVLDYLSTWRLAQGRSFSIKDAANENCDGPEVKETITELYSPKNRDCLLSNQNKEYLDNTGICLQTWLDEIKGLPTDLGSVSQNLAEDLVRWGVAVYRCALNNAMMTCRLGSLDLVIFIVNQTVPTELDSYITPQLVQQQLSYKDFLTAKRSTIGVFGDPHLLVYKSRDLITCSSNEWRTYLNNRVIRIMGKNRQIGANTQATTLSELYITFFESRGQVGVYTAAGEVLPDHFEDGSRMLDPYGHYPIRIETISNGTKIRIATRNLAYVLIVRRWGDNFFFTFRMSDPLLDNSDGLLITGCPRAERLDIAEPFAVRRRRETIEDQCSNACAGAESADGFSYTETCRFDCFTTENPAFAIMTKDFMADVVEVEAYDSQFNLTRVEPKPTTTFFTESTETSLASLAIQGSRSLPLLAAAVWFCIMTSSWIRMTSD